MKKVIGLFFAVLLCVAHVESADYASELTGILSKLQSMGHGSFTDAEWKEAMASLDAVVAKAGKSGNPNAVVEANVVKAMVYGDMKHDYRSALAILDATKSEFDGRKLPAMKTVYVREAEFYSKLGDEAAVQRVIREFEASPHYDAQAYSYSVGEGRNTPLTIIRPSSGGSGSASVTAMNVAKRQSQYAVGSLFPGFDVVDVTGKEWTGEDLRGKVVLIDFWAREWTPWKRDLDNLRSLYQRHRADGFEILGVCLEPGADDLSAYARNQRLAWPQIGNEKKLPQSLGIYGEATNFLVDKNGVIIGRDLRGADLAAFAKRALAAP